MTYRNILLFSYNAGYVHPSMGLRYLLANLGDLREHAHLLEVTRRTPRQSVLSQILEKEPAVLAISVSIWNHLDTLAVLPVLRRLLPQTHIIVGGPQVSYLPGSDPLFQYVDGLVRGESDLIFKDLVRDLRDGGPGVVPTGATPTEQGFWVLDAPLPDLSQVRQPHDTFSDRDARTRFMYLEASRGCPFQCEFCLSSLSRGVRIVPLESLFEASRSLLDRGARKFKFIDRTFNLNYRRAAQVLEFWLAEASRDRSRGIRVQFETVPDRFPPELREIIRRFPEGTLRLEVGIQTFNPVVADAISRRQDFEQSESTLAFLRDHTGATVHADLIVGLPGEDLQSFARGFNRLYLARPEEIQVGILKRLPGAPIARHDAPHQMRYNRAPPFDVISTDAMDTQTVERLKRFAKFWELVVNRGKLPLEVQRLLTGTTSPFDRFLSFSDFAYSRLRRTWGISPAELSQVIGDFLTR